MATDLEAVRGDTNTWRLTVFQPAPNDTLALDLTGASLWFSIKRSIKDTAALIVKTIGSGIVVATPASGVAVATLLPADTAPLAPGPYVYDVQLKDAAGQVTTVATGTISLAGDVTLVTT